MDEIIKKFLTVPATMTTSQITTKTKENYEDVPKQILMTAGEWGPFCRVSDKCIENIKNFKKNNFFSRVEKLKKLQNKIIKRDNYICFLEANKNKIEMDTEFNLLDEVKQYFSRENYNEVESVYKETSTGRWLGLTKPENFSEANKWYYLKHYINKDKLYLNEIYFNIPMDVLSLKPILFDGKVKNGTSLQFKMNNHAVPFISKLSVTDLPK